MQTTITESWQTAVPARIRKRFGMKAGQKIEWIEDGQIIMVKLVPDDPIAAFRGAAKNQGLTEHLLRSRRIDAARA